jgi:hypothetical protein
VDKTSKKIKFHFVKTQVKNDVWLEENSNRIALLHTHTTKPKPKPKLQTKSQSSCLVDSKDAQGRSEKASELDRSKKRKSKTNQFHEKIADNISQFKGLKTISNDKEKQKAKVRIEYEEESDGISFGDIDDEDSDDEIVTRDDVENKEHRVVGGEDKEEFDESPTVTDHSSTDGSLKRDFGPTNAEYSDVENECAKVTDQYFSRHTIPKKKNESTKKSSSIVIPKKVIPKKLQSSLSSGTSLISNAARQAMLEKKKEKKTASYSKRSFNHSPSKDVGQAGRNKVHLNDHNSPTSKRKTFSDLHSSQSHHTRIPASNGPQTTESPIKKGHNRRSMLFPRGSFNDRYSIEQRRERELYRDSKEYTARGERFSYPNSSDGRDHSIRSLSPKRSLNDRYSIDQRRERELHRNSKEYTPRGESYSYQDPSDSRNHSFRSFNGHQDMSYMSPSSDHRRGTDKSIGRNYDCYSQQDQYEADRCRHHARSHNQDNHERYRERSSEHSPRRIPNNGDVEYDQSNDEFQNGRRMNIDDTHHNDYRGFDDHSRRNEEESSMYASRSHENDHSRRTRGFNERDIERDSHLYRTNNEHEQTFSTHSVDNEFCRDDDRSSSRCRRDSGGRREKKRKRKFDGSDEYSRRLDSYNHSQERNYLNEDVRPDRYNR